MRITVVGTGYVGLVTAVCLAEVGHEVLCLDADMAKVQLLKLGRAVFYEPGLDALLRANLLCERLRFTADVAQAVDYSSVQMITVGTPQLEDGNADLSAVYSSTRSIGKLAKEFKLVVIKSTVPVGTAEQVMKIVDFETFGREGAYCEVASNPEFLREGNAINDFMRPDRIVIGVLGTRAETILRELYRPFLLGSTSFICMGSRSAELTKYAANAMLATRISLMNELANLAYLVGGDIEMVRQGISSDHRIGGHYLQSGIGYGGSCFGKDIAALIHTGTRAGAELRILRATEEANAAQHQVLLSRLVERMGGDLRGKVFAVWGLAFKPDTDDMRNAPSHGILQGLWARGASVCAYDPMAMDETRKIYGDRNDLTFAECAMSALHGASGVLLLTEWSVFISADLKAVCRLLAVPLIFDGRHIYDPASVRNAGLEYFSVGRCPAITGECI